MYLLKLPRELLLQTNCTDCLLRLERSVSVGDKCIGTKTNTGKKVKYQFWNNTGISVVLYWGIIGMFTRIPTLEK